MGEMHPIDFGGSYLSRITVAVANCQIVWHRGDLEKNDVKRVIWIEKVELRQIR